VRPFELALGPVTTFLPDNPTLYLAVDGDADALHALHAVRERVFRPPLERPLTWPFVAHVTLADDAPVSRIDAAVAALTSYAATMTVDRVTLLCEEGRVWRPIADAALGPAAVVGRGGLATEITASSLVDPEVRARRDSWWHVSDVERFGRALGRDPLVLVARREGAPVGLAEGWYSEGVAHLSGLIVDPVCRGEGIGARLLAAFESDGWQRGAHRLSLRTEPGSPEHGFYLRRGWRDEGVLTRWLAGHDFVQMGKHAR
jgi:GNAT superfamily N-acetyltransferase